MTIKDTIESRMLELQASKRAIADQTFGDGANLDAKGAKAKLTMTDIMFLFGREAENRGDDKADTLAAKKTNLLRSESSSQSLTTTDWEASRPAAPRAHERDTHSATHSKATRAPESSVWGRR